MILHRQVGGKLGDEPAAAPVRPKAARVEQRNVAGVEGGGVVAGDDVAVALVRR